MNRLSKVLRLTALSAALISSTAFADSSGRNDDDRYGQYRQDGDDGRADRDGHKERDHKDRDDGYRSDKRHEDKDNRYGQYGSRGQAQYPRYGNEAPRDRDHRSHEEGRYRYEVYANGGHQDRYGRYADYNRAYYGYDNPRYDRFDYRAARNWSRQNNYYGFKQLPPGIRMNMARGKKVPYGISYRRLPPQYLSYLPRYRGYEWRGYGNDLVLVGTGNWIIAEVIRGALG